MGKPRHLAKAAFIADGMFGVLLRLACSLTFVQTSLASRAIDAFHDEATRAEVRAQLLKYLETDTIWCVITSSW